MRRLISLNPTVHCIGVASSPEVPAAGCWAEALRQAGLPAAIRKNGLGAEWRCILAATTGPTSELPQQLATATAAVIAGGDRPLVVGDAPAGGTWQGIASALGEAPGLVWIAAPDRVHDPSLLGACDPARRVVIGGSDSPAAPGVRCFTLEDIAAQGFAAVFSEARRLMDGGPWGVRLDLDSIDGSGIAAADLAAALRGILRERLCVGLEIVAPSAANRHTDLVLSLADAAAAPDAATLRRWEGGFGARNYAPLPVVLSEGHGCWLTDVNGRRYLDLMAAYSATSFGHGHPRLVAALTAQAGRLAVTSRAYFNDRLPLLLRRLTLLTGYDRALPVNTGLEAVETALKAARKWAHTVKGVPAGQAEIIACEGNFHGRSIAIVGLSSEAQYRHGFGPFPPGLKQVPYGDAAALAAAITPHTAAFLVEPIQGEAGIVPPPPGYLAACAAICREHDVLLIADEVQTGLGRTGKLLACEHDGVRPDGVILGKALGGGLLPVSAFLADEPVMGVFTPGDHGSTFGGNPLAAAVALAALDVLEEEGLVAHSAELGELLLARLQELAAALPMIRAVRGRGLFAAIEVDPQQADARQLAEALLEHGVLTKETHGTVLRLAPPLIIKREELEWGVARIAETLEDFRRHQPRAA